MTRPLSGPLIALLLAFCWLACGPLTPAGGWKADDPASSWRRASPTRSAIGPAEGGPADPRRASSLIAALGRDRLVVGAHMDDAVASSAPFDLRTVYLAGGISDGIEPCADCTRCTAAGKRCGGSAAEGCGWWGCWQWDRLPPGQHVRDLLAKCSSLGQIPFITWYQLLHSSRVPEGAPLVGAVADLELMTRYFNDWRFLLRIIGDEPVMLHLEPDFWAFAEQRSADPHRLPAAISRANPVDCGAVEDTVAGLGRCLISMARRYAPNAKIGLHASGWGTRIDVLYNRRPGLDVAARARQTARFLLEAGAEEADFVAVDVSDRDAGYYQTQRRDTWWDPANRRLPHFHQAFTWGRALSEAVGRPILWWMMPVGHEGLEDRRYRWKDNRVDYFFAHTGEVAETNAIGMTFGAGAEGQTTPASDGGHLVRRVRAYVARGGQPPAR